MPDGLPDVLGNELFFVFCRSPLRPQDSSDGTHDFQNGVSSDDVVIMERKRIIDAMNEIDAKLAEMDSEDDSLLNSAEDFTQKASYFIMVDALLGNKSGDPVGLVRSIDPAVIKSFINTVISKVVIKNGVVSSIHFRNGMVHKFVYK